VYFNVSSTLWKPYFTWLNSRVQISKNLLVSFPSSNTLSRVFKESPSPLLVFSDTILNLRAIFSYKSRFKNSNISGTETILFGFGIKINPTNQFQRDVSAEKVATQRSILDSEHSVSS